MFVGRDLRIRRGAATIAGGQIRGSRSDSLSISRTYQDITKKYPDGVRRLLPNIVGFSIDISVDGVLRDNTLLDYSLETEANTGLFELSIDIATIGTFTGIWGMGSFSCSGASGADPISFSASFQSHGPTQFIRN